MTAASSVDAEESYVLNAIEAGRIFVREGTVLPETLQIESELYIPGWRSVKNLDGYGLGRKIQAAGWNFFYLAYETKATVFGIDGEKMIRRAIERILANREAEAEKFNSLEIVRLASLASKRYLGIRHVTVSARSRHIQEGPVIFQVQDKDFEVAAPSKIELRPDQSIGLLPSKEVPLDEVKMPNLESVHI
ncbi:MAG: hypothetical protein DMG32_23505 [Acidobacteria bacterium]|nr:MAG: hypothetical protein DMG32_23505 [Acidobacteriota bacterium]